MGATAVTAMDNNGTTNRRTRKTMAVTKSVKKTASVAARAARRVVSAPATTTITTVRMIGVTVMLTTVAASAARVARRVASVVAPNAAKLSVLPSPSVIRPRTARDTTVVMNHVKSSVNSSNSEVVRRVALAARRVASVRAVAPFTTMTVRTIGVTVTTPATTVAREARRVATTVAVKKSAKKSAVTVPFTLDRSLLPRSPTSTPITLLPRRAFTTLTGKLYLYD